MKHLSQHATMLDALIKSSLPVSSLSLSRFLSFPLPLPLFPSPASSLSLSGFPRSSFAPSSFAPSHFCCHLFLRHSLASSSRRRFLFPSPLPLPVAATSSRRRYLFPSPLPLSAAASPVLISNELGSERARCERTSVETSYWPSTTHNGLKLNEIGAFNSVINISHELEGE